MTQEIRDAVARAVLDGRVTGNRWLWVSGHNQTPNDVAEQIATAALTALSACEPTPEMVEAAARELAGVYWDFIAGTENGYERDPIAATHSRAFYIDDEWSRKEHLARAAVSAALKMVGK